MAKTEEGEFELVLGNNQLLSVFFLVVLLLALCFVGGYVVGRNAGPTLAAAPAAPSSSAAPEVLIAREDTFRAQPEPAAPVALKPVEPPPEPIRSAPPKTEEPAPVATQPSISSQPVSGRIYLQLSATDKDRAETMVDLIRSKNMPAIAAAIADRPNLYRVLVGPLTDAELPETRAQLKANSFPADEAIRRVF